MNSLMKKRDSRFSCFRAALSQLCLGIGLSAIILPALGSQTTSAQNIFSFFGANEPPPPPAAQPEPDAKPRHTRRGGRGRVAFASRLSLCVRLCDGFAFPMGTYRGSGDRELHESACHTQCPDADTALYVAPGDADSFADARSAEDGSAYSELPHAFAYRKVLDRSCRCHAHGHRTLASVLLDRTLRRGDVLMTTQGMKVFEGGASYPHQPSDFSKLAASKDVEKDERSRLRAMEQVSLVPAAPQEGRAVQEDAK